MPERAFLDFLYIPILTALGWHEKAKVSRVECMRVHAMTDKKLDDIHADVKCVKELVIKHISKSVEGL
jgi:hypothetical protein